MKNVFDPQGDTMPNGRLSAPKKKLIHQQGGVGKAKFISNGNHDYTGVLKGSENAIIRFSAAA